MKLVSGEAKSVLEAVSARVKAAQAQARPSRPEQQVPGGAAPWRTASPPRRGRAAFQQSLRLKAATVHSLPFPKTTRRGGRLPRQPQRLQPACGRVRVRSDQPGLPRPGPAPAPGPRGLLLEEGGEGSGGRGPRGVSPARQRRRPPAGQRPRSLRCPLSLSLNSQRSFFRFS